MKNATADSRIARREDLFVAIPGTQANGEQFIGDALQKGATALLTQNADSTFNVPTCVVSDVRTAWAQLSSALKEQPQDALTIAGVTGTNGKTTTTWLLRSIFKAADLTAGLLGTIEYDNGNYTRPAPMTTPDSPTLFSMLDEMNRADCSHATLEISSHALDQHRAHGINLSTAVITNVTQDHFDYHGTFENYLAAKRQIIELCRPDARVVVNADDPGCREILASSHEDRLVTFGLNHFADVHGHILTSSSSGSRFLVTTAAGEFDVRTPLVGRHNVMNCLAATAVALELGIEPTAIAKGISDLHCVPGRMEKIASDLPIDVYVDYAHTHDALAHSLQTTRQLTRGRVHCVFGAGGDRDATKRPLLGKASGAADCVIVTSDNPRSEEPANIIQQVMNGVPSGVQCHSEVDRAKAIEQALRIAEPGDSVLIAGKGHETVQELKSTSVLFDDREIARKLLRQIRLDESQLPQRAVA